jgi:hypothetical protein
MTNQAQEVFCQGRFPVSLIYVLRGVLPGTTGRELSMANCYLTKSQGMKHCYIPCLIYGVIVSTRKTS